MSSHHVLNTSCKSICVVAASLRDFTTAGLYEDTCPIYECPPGWWDSSYYGPLAQPHSWLLLASLVFGPYFATPIPSQLHGEPGNRANHWPCLCVYSAVGRPTYMRTLVARRGTRGNTTSQPTTNVAHLCKHGTKQKAAFLSVLIPEIATFMPPSKKPTDENQGHTTTIPSNNLQNLINTWIINRYAYHCVLPSLHTLPEKRHVYSIHISHSIPTLHESEHKHTQCHNSQPSYCKAWILHMGHE